jgi:HD superfamily phosphodiesterase
MKKRHFDKNEKPILADLVDTGSPVSVLREVESILTMVYPGFDHEPIRRTHADVVDLFEGHYPGYRKCVTGYHDLGHTMDVLLAMARLIHGVHRGGYTLNRDNVTLGLLGAMLHDTGYIQRSEEAEGGSHFEEHVVRSVGFMKELFARNGCPADDAEKCRVLIESASLDTDPGEIRSGNEELRMLGKMVFAANLLGQMADRMYLEKLHLLYFELVEGGITKFNDEKDLLEKSIGFYETTISRLRSELSDIDRYMRNHFRERWDIDRDLYSESISSNIGYLKHILAHHKDDYRRQLKRGDILERLGDLKARP